MGQNYRYLKNSNNWHLRTFIYMHIYIYKTSLETTFLRKLIIFNKWSLYKSASKNRFKVQDEEPEKAKLKF